MCEGIQDMVKVITRLENVPIQEWDIHDVSYKVSQICQENKLPRNYLFYFRKSNVNGTKLLEFDSASDLSSLGIENKEHQQILFQELQVKSVVDTILNLFRNFGGSVKKMFG
jgi:hypothetical protein